MKNILQQIYSKGDEVSTDTQDDENILFALFYWYGEGGDYTRFQKILLFFLSYANTKYVC